MARHKLKSDPEISRPASAAPVVTVLLSKCPACSSTRRGDYRGTQTQLISGKAPDNSEYNTVIWRYCNCLDCGQVRCDRSFEMRRPESASGPFVPDEIDDDEGE